MLDGRRASRPAWRTRGRSIGVELRSFAENTLEYIEKEAELTFEPLELPDLDVDIHGRHALVVVRGHDYQHDLQTLRPYIREYQPVLIAVDGGADALLEIGSKPRHHHRRLRLAVGRRVAVRRRARSHHVHPDGRAPGRDELLAASGVPFTTSSSPRA